ncbi:MAG: ABC transporter permease [Candidatus Riflebacteria bacterium]|nr:ABC transporter permease [Candidatus Riflebacteria bacterium]
MSAFLADTLYGAFLRLLTLDVEVFGILLFSLKIAVTATLSGAVFAVPIALLIHRRTAGWKAALMLALQTWLAVPTVIIGTLVYIVISRRGPLGVLDMLYSPTAIIVGDILLVTPLMVTFLVNSFAQVPIGLIETARNLGAGPIRLLILLSRECRSSLFVGLCAGFGRVISEVGCAMMLGGNIRGQTRTMTTAIALEMGKGEIELGLALGFLLLLVALGNAAFIQWLQIPRFRSSRRLSEPAKFYEETKTTGLTLVNFSDSEPGADVFHGDGDAPIDIASAKEADIVSGKQDIEKEPVHLRDVTLVFPGHTLFERLNASLVVTGNMLLSGRSGAGKTTLLRMLCGLQSPDAGEIELSGREAVLVFQRPYLFAGTVLENLMYGVRCRGKRSDQAKEDVLSIAKELGLYNMLDRDASCISGGEASRVALGRALAVKPTLLLLDEPFVHLDDRSRMFVLRSLQRFTGSGSELILVSHETEYAKTVCAHRVRLENGRIIEESS